MGTTGVKLRVSFKRQESVFEKTGLRMVSIAQDKLGARFLRLTVFNILSNITVPLAGLADTAMLGRLSDINYLSGVALGGVVFTYIYWSFSFLRMGSTGSVAQARGQGDEGEVYNLLYRYVGVALFFSFLILIFRDVLGDIAFMLSAGEPEVKQAGREYYNARILGAPAALINMALLGWFIGRENGGIVLLVTITGNGANIALNYVFIYQLGWSSYGAGLASAIGQYITLLSGLICLFPVASKGLSGPDYAKVIEKKALMKMFSLNRDIWIRTILLITVLAFFVNQGANLGARTLAANAILFQFFLSGAFFIDGVAYASESLAGVSLGGRDARILKRVMSMGLTLGLFFAFLFCLPVIIFPRGLFALFTSHENVVAEAVYFSPWLFPVFVFGGPAFVYDGVFLGLTRGEVLRNTMIFCAMLFAPLAFCAKIYMNNHLLWAGFSLFMLGRALILGYMFRSLIARF